MVANSPSSEQLDDTFFALSNSTRRAILARLAEGDASVNELAEPFAMSLPAISKHLKVLERAGLVARTRIAQYRPCQLTPEPLDAASAWVQSQRTIWQSRFTQLENELARLQASSEPATSTQTKIEPNPSTTTD